MTSNGGADRRRRRYTAAQREQILKDAEEMGVGEAAGRHAMPASTVFNWRRMLGHSEPAAASPETGSGEERIAEGGGAKAGCHVDEGVKAERAPARRYTPSEKAQALEKAAAEGVSETSRELGISRFSIYQWRTQAQHAAAGEGPCPTSGPLQGDIEAQRDREILAEWQKHPGLGPSQVRNQLRRRGIKVSVQTTRRVMEDAGYRPPKVKHERHDKRYEAVRPNHLWHIDFVQRYINRASTFTLILIDDHSRYVVGHGVDDAERASMVIDTFEDAVRRHGKPEAVMHDKGAAFWSWRGISQFTALLTELGVDQIVAEKKEHNGKVENFNGNLHKELFDRHRFYDIAEMRRRLAAHLHWYNHARTHHALGGLLVPGDRYYGRAEEVLARIESGIGRELGDELDLRDRRLDLFKVLSVNGATEVWLMGQRLLRFPSQE
jgi:transposase InsO family protein